MICSTVKEGVECAFMKTSGCSYNEGVCQPVVEECQGCKRVADFAAGQYCNATPEPSSKWKNGKCNLATHIKEEATAKVKINPLKASKRGG